MSEPSYIDLHPTYQISFSAEDVGKRLAASKREIRWRFGFPNVQALNAGETGPTCRGEEHEVVIYWSITSGKKVVILDNQEIHNSTGRVNTFYHSFIVRGKHVVKLEANLTRHENLNQYDLWIDGISFFRMPKVFQLGIKGAIPNEKPGTAPPVYAPDRVERPLPPPISSTGRQYDFARGQYIEPPVTAQQEEEDLQKAIARSIEDTRNHLVAKGKDAPPTTLAPATTTTAPKQQDLLIDFFSDPIPTAQPVQQQLVNTSNNNNYWASQQNDMSGMGASTSAAPAYSQNNHMYGGGYPSSSSTAMPAYNDPFSSNVQHYPGAAQSSSSLNYQQQHSATNSNGSLNYQQQAVATQSYTSLNYQPQPQQATQNKAVENPFAAASKAHSTFSSPAPYNVHGSNPFAENPFSSPTPTQQQTATNNQYPGYSNQQQVPPAPAAYNGYPSQGQQNQYQQYNYGYQTTQISPTPSAGVAPGAMQSYSNLPQQNKGYGNYQF